MDLASQQLYMELFFSSCIATTQNRSRDYAPEGIPLLHTLRAAVEADIEIHQSLWQLYSKQHTAIIRYYFRNERLDSDSPTSRLVDAVNLLAFMSFFESHRYDLYDVWYEYWTNQECECVPDTFEWDGMFRADCHKHRTLAWLQRRRLPAAFEPTSSPSTQRVPGSSPTDPLDTGATTQPDPSPSRSAIRRATLHTSDGK